MKGKLVSSFIVKRKKKTLDSIIAMDKIFIQYETDSRCADSFDLSTHKQINNIPLHPDNWNYAKDHMGEEVEFNIIHNQGGYPGNPIESFAELILSTPKVYTEEEVKEFILKTREIVLNDIKHYLTNTLFILEWWNENKKK